MSFSLPIWGQDIIVGERTWALDGSSLPEGPVRLEGWCWNWALVIGDSLAALIGRFIVTVCLIGVRAIDLVFLASTKSHTSHNGNEYSHLLFFPSESAPLILKNFTEQPHRQPCLPPTEVNTWSSYRRARRHDPDSAGFSIVLDSFCSWLLM